MSARQRHFEGENGFILATRSEGAFGVELAKYNTISSFQAPPNEKKQPLNKSLPWTSSALRGEKAFDAVLTVMNEFEEIRTKSLPPPPRPYMWEMLLGQRPKPVTLANMLSRKYSTRTSVALTGRCFNRFFRAYLKVCVNPPQDS